MMPSRRMPAGILDKAALKPGAFSGMNPGGLHHSHGSHDHLRRCCRRCPRPGAALLAARIARRLDVRKLCAARFWCRLLHLYRTTELKRQRCHCWRKAAIAGSGRSSECSRPVGEPRNIPQPRHGLTGAETIQSQGINPTVGDHRASAKARARLSSHAAAQKGRHVPLTVVRRRSRRWSEGKSVRAWLEQRLSQMMRSPLRQTWL